MKHLRILTLLLALCLALTACSSGRDTAVIATYAGGSVPAGVYLYEITSAFSEAAAIGSSDTGNLLEGSVEGTPAADWIRDRALETVKEFAGTELLYDRLGLASDETEEAGIKSSQESMWNYYGPQLEERGIARTSLDAIVRGTYKREAVLQAIYGAGGEQEISDDVLRAYYRENYRRVEMLVISKLGLSDEGLVEASGLLDGYYDRAVAGEEMTALIAEEYARRTDTTVEEAAELAGDNQAVLVTRDSTGYPQALIEQIFAVAETGVPQTYTSDDYDVLFIVRELLETDAAEADYLSSYDTLLAEAAADDFAARLAQAADDAGYSVNQKAVQRYQVAKVLG